MSSLFNLPWQQAFDGSGHTLPGAKLYFYTAGTSEPQNVFADVGLGTALPNPVIANASGRFVPIYMDDIAYKVALYNAKDELLWTADNVYAQSIDADASVALAAIRAVSVSAGYDSEQALVPSNFSSAVYKYANGSNYFSETGIIDNVYVLSTSEDYVLPTDYFLGMQLIFYTSRANTSSATINVAGLGAKNIKRYDGSSLVAGDVSGLMHLVYNGSSFLIMDGVNLTSAQTISGVKTFEESPIIPTPEQRNNSTKSANTQFVQSELLISTSPDYANKTTTTDSLTVTAPGWVSLYTDVSNGGTATMSINGVEVWRQYIIGDRGAWGAFTSPLYKVWENDEVTTSSTGTRTISFYPERVEEEEDE